MSKTKHLLTVQELADILQVSYKTALKVMKDSITYIQVAGQYRIHPKHVNRFINNNVK